MKNKWIKLAGAVLAVLAVTASVQATSIIGSIGFSGTYTQNGGTHGTLSTATSFGITTVAIGGPPTGVFVGATTPAFATPIGVNGNAPSLVGVQLWSVIVGSTTYSMVVTTESQPFTSTTSIILQGNGTMQDGNAADNTGGFWQIAFGAAGESFTWQNTSNSVPDGGATVMLLGIALSGLGLLKKKLTA
jgi:hypothetical protein